MNYHYDATGERVEDQDDDNPVDITPRTRDEIHHERCAELRKILKSARDRREAQP